MYITLKPYWDILSMFFSFLINILCKNYMFIDIRFAVFEIVCNGKCLNVLDLKLL